MSSPKSAAVRMITLGILLAVAFNLETLRVSAIERNWVGGGLVGMWSNPGNWNPSGVPQNGDQLNFDAGFPPPSGVMVNDLTNLTVQHLAFPSGAWQLSGNELGVIAAIGNSGDGLVEIYCAIRLEGITTFPALSYFPEKSSDLRLTGAINLNGRLLRLLARSEVTVEADGVALAAIQGLNQKLKQKETEIAELKQAVNELKELVEIMSRN
ncbi:MAG: hypothetical protein ABIV39_13210 [Verrucomicrobiota bacterium]